MPRSSRRPAPGPSNSIAKALTVLRAFMDRQDHWGVRELATMLDQPLSSTHWLLQILRSEGLVEWSPSRKKYVAGPELERWGAALAGRARRHELGGRAAAALSAKAGADCWYAVHDAPRKRLVVMAQAVRGPQAEVRPGASLPLLSGPAGWAVLALLPPAEQAELLADAPEEVRRGVAEAARAGFASARGLVAAAVCDAAGAPVGALLATGSPELADLLREEASALSRRLGGRILAGVRGTAPHLLADLGMLLQERVPELSLDDAGLGNTERLTAIQEGKAGYCAVTLERIDAAWRGAPPFDAPHDRLRLVMPLAPVQLHIIVHRDALFQAVADLLTARVAAGESDYVTADVWREILALVAPSEAARRRAEARMAPLSYADANEAFAAGELDALVSLNTAPVPGYQELGRRVPLRLIPMEQRLMRAFIARHPTFAEGAIDAGFYAGAHPPVATLVTVLGVATSALRSEDEVYRVTQALAERLDRTRPQAACWPSGSEVPLHPGAARYWRE